MPVNLSIKNAPDEIVARLKERATKHHSSLQGELMAIIEDAVCTPRRLTPKDALAEGATTRSADAYGRSSDHPSQTGCALKSSAPPFGFVADLALSITNRVTISCDRVNPI
jgi:antitoxin FitA